MAIIAAMIVVYENAHANSDHRNKRKEGVLLMKSKAEGVPGPRIVP